MGKACCAVGCTNRYKKGDGRSFYRFPAKNVERRQQWVSAVRRQNWKPDKDSWICSDHYVVERRAMTRSLQHINLQFFPLYGHQSSVSMKLTLMPTGAA